MAAHRWDTEPPDTLTTRLAARREAASAATDAVDAEPRRRRWGFPFRAAVLSACLLLAGAVAFPLMRDPTPHEAVSIELDVPDAVETTGTGESGGDGTAAAGVSTDAEEPPGQVLPGSNPSDDNAGTGQAGTELVVHVAGSVVSPGIVKVRPGSRVADAVEAAGGATPDADLRLVNLAAPLEDGNMVVVPVQGDPTSGAGASGAEAGVAGAAAGPGSGMAGELSGGAGTEAETVNLNTAGEAELQTLPRIGPVLAARIIAWRTDHGRFTRPEDLDAVPGIGEAMLNALLPLVTV